MAWPDSKLDKIVEAIRSTVQWWPTSLFAPSHAETVDAMKGWLRRHDYFCRVRESGNTAVAMPGGLWLPRNWHARGDLGQALLLTHELGHFFHREHDHDAITKLDLGWFGRYMVPWQAAIAETGAELSELAYASLYYSRSPATREAYVERGIEAWPSKVSSLGTYPHIRILTVGRRRRRQFEATIKRGMVLALADWRSIVSRPPVVGGRV